MVICPKCHQEVAEAKFCSACGEELYTQANFCGECGKPLENQAKFCKECGAPQELSREKITSPSSIDSRPFSPQSIVPKKKSRSKLWLWLSIGALVLVVILFLIFLKSQSFVSGDPSKPTLTNKDLLKVIVEPDKYKAYNVEFTGIVFDDPTMDGDYHKFMLSYGGGPLSGIFVYYIGDMSSIKKDSLIKLSGVMQGGTIGRNDKGDEHSFPYITAFLAEPGSPDDLEIAADPSETGGNDQTEEDTTSAQPASDAPIDDEMVEGLAVAFPEGQLVIETDGAEKEYPVDANVTVTEHGEPSEWTKLHANVELELTIKDGIVVAINMK